MRSQRPNSGGINLETLIPDAQFLNFDNRRIQSCCGNWEDCRDNDLYVALVQPDCDGHEYATKAIQRGASAVLCERLLAVTAPQCIVEDSRTAFGQVCHALAGNPSGHVNAIGISGTDGKTTTSHLLHSIFEQAGVSAGLSSSLHNPPACDPATNRWLSGSAPQTAQLMSDMVMEGHQFAVVETSSVDLAQHNLSGVQLDAAILTNVRGNHFEFHGSLTNYRNAERRLLDYLKPSGFAVLNADDPASYNLLDEIDAPAITVGIRQAAEIQATVIEQTSTDQTFLITAGSESITIRSHIIGEHHIYNCLCATAVALTYGLDLPTIARGLEKVQSLPGRMEMIRCGQLFQLAIDQALTPYRLGVALTSMKKTCKGKVICVFSNPEPNSRKLAEQFGRIAERWADLPVITLNRTEEAVDYEPGHTILDGFSKPKKARLMPKRIDAIEWALSQAGPDDAVLIAGQGERPIASVGDKRWTLTDRDVCEAWLFGEPSSSKGRVEEGPMIFRMDDYR